METKITDNSEWTNHQLMMTKHKLFEGLEKLNKQETDTLSDADYRTYKDCLKALYYLQALCKNGG